MVPLLAILAVAGKKMFELIRQSMPVLKRQTAKPNKPCCCSSNYEPIDLPLAEISGPRKST
jgi:hypothetical protein